MTRPVVLGRACEEVAGAEVLVALGDVEHNPTISFITTGITPIDSMPYSQTAGGVAIVDTIELALDLEAIQRR